MGRKKENDRLEVETRLRGNRIERREKKTKEGNCGKEEIKKMKERRRKERSRVCRRRREGEKRERRKKSIGNVKRRRGASISE